VSLAGELVEGAAKLLEEVLGMHARATEAEQREIRELLEAADQQLGKVEPNAPRLRELVARRRAARAELERRERERTERGDEPTGKIGPARLPVTSDPSVVDRSIEPTTGMQRQYLVLSAEDRAKGFVRPFRDKYRHLTCGTTTTMGTAIAETYARQPDFYGGTFCVRCRAHFPVGEDGEFVWDGTNEKVGT
jgi:hypothetical protein